MRKTVVLGLLLAASAIPASANAQSLLKRGLKALGEAVAVEINQGAQPKAQKPASTSPPVPAFETTAGSAAKNFVTDLNRQAVAQGDETRYVLLDQKDVSVDFDADGDADRALILTACESVSCNPTTNWSVVAIFRNEAGRYVKAAEYDLEANPAFVEAPEGQIVITSYKYGDEDPTCCASIPVRHTIWGVEGVIKQRIGLPASPATTMSNPFPTSIPARYRGVWAPDAAACNAKRKQMDPVEMGGIRISSDEVSGFEFGLKFSRSLPGASDTFTFAAIQYSEAGEENLNQTATLRQTGNSLTLRTKSGSSYDQIFVRCVGVI